jgi:hypothetical protein
MQYSVVPLLILKKGGKSGNCTGAIVKERGALMLLTAAHCTKDLDSLYIVESRRPDETMEAWRVRITGKKNKSIRVKVKANQKHFEAKTGLEKGEHDFAMGVIKKSEADPDIYEKFRRNALTIGYDVDTSPEKLAGNIKYIGAGTTESMSEYGVLKEGRFNIEAKPSPTSRAIIVDVCESRMKCTKTRPGDSGSPLLYQDPVTKENKVIGTLLGGRTESESIYANLGGNRFPDKIDGIIKALECKASN